MKIAEAMGERGVMMQIAPVPHEVRRVRETLVRLVPSYGMRDGEVADFLTAVCEAVANAIEHAATNDPIEVSCVREGDAVIASVVDHGVGFDVPQKASRTNLPSTSSERGRGLPIMRRCSDIFRVHSVPGLGTTVVLGRYLDAHAGAHDDRGVDGIDAA